MSDDAEDDLAATAWPGFVDILSSVLIMFVFFLMITAVALAFHTILYKSKIKSQIEEKSRAVVEEKVESTTAEIKKENEELKKKIEEIMSDATFSEEVKRDLETKLELTQDTAILAESKSQTIVDEGDNTIRVNYGPDAISITDEARVEIIAFLEQFNPNTMRVIIEASRDTSNAIEATARRVAVARMLNLRNIVIEFEVPNNAINAQIIQGEEIDGLYDWVRLRVEQDQ